MRRICGLVFFAVLFFAVSCNRKQSAFRENSDPVSEQVGIGSDSAGLPVDTAILADAVSGATDVANEPTFNGEMAVPPQCRASVTLTMDGIVHTISCYSGEYVEKGQVLASLENPAFILLQQNYLESSAQTEFLEKEYRRQKLLSSRQAASEKTFQESKASYLSMKSRLEAASAQLILLGVDPTALSREGIRPYIEVRAPLSGYVADLKVNLGTHLSSGEPVCNIIAKQENILCLRAYEKDLVRIKVGDSLDFRVNGWEGRVFHAVVTSIDQEMDKSSRSFLFYARVESRNPYFRPGMYVTANIRK